MAEQKDMDRFEVVYDTTRYKQLTAEQLMVICLALINDDITSRVVQNCMTTAELEIARLPEFRLAATKIFQHRPPSDDSNLRTALITAFGIRTIDQARQDYLRRLRLISASDDLCYLARYYGTIFRKLSASQGTTRDREQIFLQLQIRGQMDRDLVNEDEADKLSLAVIDPELVRLLAKAEKKED